MVNVGGAGSGRFQVDGAAIVTSLGDPQKDLVATMVRFPYNSQDHDR